jgi:hypothetical protein
MEYHKLFAELASKVILPMLASQVARITGMSHQHHPENRVLK